MFLRKRFQFNNAINAWTLGNVIFFMGRVSIGWLENRECKSVGKDYTDDLKKHLYYKFRKLHITRRDNNNK